ncbi:hypothetical protein EL22_16280 [Halostagnicola sp. A56]|uniref:HdeD family acid-resistance protein n=1 Tax=Halostagnicola sp. A56 TaxID=1495067 RepID=UPI00049EEFD2|nr:HdeD family acid-resistance protein [Halostagnicola sp. A56]KDE59853.1 hypothetical protein EL22_16280 [Halostagnicola sp. A56]
MSSTTTTDESTPGYSLERGWRTLALAGGVIGLLGLFAIALPVVTGLSVAVVLGAVLIVSGIVHGAHSVTTRGWKGSAWQLAVGAVSLVAGLFVLANPVIALVSLTLLLVAYLVVDGIAELWMATRMAGEPGRATIGASGAVSLVLAALLWAGFPADAAWAIGLIVGVSLLFTGISMAAVAISGRRGDETTAPAGEPRRA